MMSKRVALQEAFKLALSMALLYWLALSMNWDMPGNGGLAIILVSLGTAGASFNKGVMRMIGTTFGLLVAFVAIALFGQSLWGTLIFFTLYIVFIGYMMQLSNNSYAWFVAGFLPPLVWASCYMSDDMGLAAFQYGSFRYLETSSGILIYTVISVLIWPQRAGAQLRQEGEAVWMGIKQQFGIYRGLVGGEKHEPDLSGQRAKLAGSLAQMTASLKAAYGDSSSAKYHKRLWEVTRVNLRGMVDGLDLWGESVRDCCDFDLQQHLSGPDQALSEMDRRLERILGLWSETVEESPDQDSELLKPLALELTEKAKSGLSHTEVADLTGFVFQWRLLDQISIELLRGSRMLAQLDSREGPLPEQVVEDRVKRVWWNPQRLVNALFPAACFMVAVMLWIFINPPGGPSIPSTVVAISLNFVLARMNPMALLKILFISLWFFTGPVYMWVMPALGGGAGLLVLIFVYTFVFAYVGANKKPLKLVPILLFVEVTGISNQQSYSFMALIDGAMLFLICLSVIAVVDMLWTSRRPEKNFTTSLRRFFRACAAITDSFSAESHRGEMIRKRHFDSAVLGVPGQLQALAQQLDSKQFPGNEESKMQDLLDGLQAIILRLQAVELVHQQLGNEDSAWMNKFEDASEQLRHLVRDAFLDLSRFEGGEFNVDHQTRMKNIAQALGRHLDEMRAVEDSVSVAFHALLGNVRGLLVAIGETRKAMTCFDWPHMAKARF